MLIGNGVSKKIRGSTYLNICKIRHIPANISNGASKQEKKRISLIHASISTKHHSMNTP